MGLKIINAIDSLLPNSLIWRRECPNIKALWGAVARTFENACTYVNVLWTDTRPEATRFLSTWENQMGLGKYQVLADVARRSRLEAYWKTNGGQSPSYIQGVLREVGFDVYVYDWWVPGQMICPTAGSTFAHAGDPRMNAAECGLGGIGGGLCAIPRNPLEVLRQEFTGTVLYLECGEEFVECGEPGVECGERDNPEGYPLVNIIKQTEYIFDFTCGEEFVECGEPGVECGEASDFITGQQEYILPSDRSKWAYIVYVGGKKFGETAEVPYTRKNELEDLCLKIFPAHLWIGMIIRYV